jgi:MOSC domain-containing protein YiiM
VEHYDFWHTFPGLAGMRGGAFGENFTTRGLTEDTACIGDTFRVGQAVVMITQPRGPCYKLNRRWGFDDLQRLAEETHRYGWYLSVLQEGRVEAGSPMERIEQPFPAWTVRRVWEVTKGPLDRQTALALIAVPALSEGWRESLQKRLDR